MVDAPFTFDVSEDSPDQRTFQLTGPFTLNNMFAFQSKLREVEPMNTIIDLAKVPYVDSAGMGCIVNAHVALQKNGKKLVLIGVNERVKNLLSITRMDKLMPIFDTLDDYKASGS